MANTDLIYTLIAIVVPLVELLGILAAVHAIMNARTSQGAIAWAISLITFPWLALILYAILGRNKFKGYVLLRSAKDQNIHHYIEKIQKEAVSSLYPGTSQIDTPGRRSIKKPGQTIERNTGNRATTDGYRHWLQIC